MKIAIDSWVLASRFRYQGTYVYAQSLIAEFKKIARTSPEVQFCLFTSPRNSNDAGLVEVSERFQLVQTSLLGHDRLWRLGGASRAAARAQADLIFAPTLSVLPVGKIPLICTIHDVTPVVMPSHSKKVTILQRSLLWFASRMARSIITDSECSKNDLLKLYGLAESKVKVVYLGYDKGVFNDVAPDPELQKTLLTKLGIEKPYILHHGMIQPRKNLKRLIEAYRLLLDRNKNLDFDLLLAGAMGWEYEEILTAAANGAGKQGRIVFPGTLDAPDLALLIKGASMVVIPSLYEGFCLPMVEAMACGVPVVAANTSCLPEVSGGVLRYFDPRSLEEMAALMEQMLEDEQLRKTLAEEGTKRAAFFDWHRCAEETLAVFREEL
ncbi:MAG TPA: glycosyltransferase family 1 protein [Candidatus Angelobacter sp.]|nr:glycosyltransferase family 1 protein [Candidatus Angelobacter sp.]